MPQNRLLHQRAGHSVKVCALSDFEFRVWVGMGLIRSRGHVPKGGYDVPNGSNHTSAVTPAMQ